MMEKLSLEKAADVPILVPVVPSFQRLLSEGLKIVE